MEIDFNFKKIKLPRKRKKAYIKAKGKSNYLGLQIVGELLVADGIKHANRFYSYRPIKSEKEMNRPDYKNGFIIEKRW